MREPLRFKPRKGPSFEAEVGAEPIAEGSTSLVTPARRVSGAAHLPETLVVKHAKRGFEFLLQTERVVVERLEHPNLVRFLGAAKHEGELLLAYERLGAQPLLALNARGVRPAFRDPRTTYYPLPPGRALELAFDLVQGLVYLHSRGFAHGRVRPSSLLVRVGGDESSSEGILASVAGGSFEGVLASLRNARPLDWHARWRKGEGAKIPAPVRDPVYTPPDVMSGEVAGELAADVYAFALVFFTLLTGRLPYEGQGGRAALEQLKQQEARGKVSPIDLDALDAIPLHDSPLAGPPSLWLELRSAVEHLLRRCLDPDPARRPEIGEVHHYFEAELRMRSTLARGARPWTQGFFQTQPRGDRLAPAADETVRIREEAGEPVVEKRRRSAAPAARAGPARGVLRARRAPAGMRFLVDLLRERRDGWPLSVRCPVLVTVGTLDATKLATGLVFSLGGAAARILVAGDRVEPRTRVAVGRGDGNDICLDELDVAKRHLVFDRREGQWWVEDLGSASGTKVDGRKVRPGAPYGLATSKAVVTLGGRAELTLLDEGALESFLARALEVVVLPPTDAADAGSARRTGSRSSRGGRGGSRSG